MSKKKNRPVQQPVAEVTEVIEPVETVEEVAEEVIEVVEAEIVKAGKVVNQSVGLKTKNQILEIL